LIIAAFSEVDAEPQTWIVKNSNKFVDSARPLVLSNDVLMATPGIRSKAAQPRRVHLFEYRCNKRSKLGLSPNKVSMKSIGSKVIDIIPIII